MFKLWKSLIILLFVGVCVSAESGEGEDGTGERFDGDLEVFRYNIQQPDSEQDSSSVEIYVPKRKRDVAATTPTEKTASTDAAEPPKVLLTDLIGKVEGSIVQSAVNIAQLLKGSKNNSAVSSTPAVKQEAETEAPRVKRAAESTSEAIAENKDTIVKYVTTKKVATEPNEAPHVTIDHIAVSDAKGGLAPLFSSLDFIVKEAPRLVADTVAGKSTDANKNGGSVSELSVVSPTSTSLSKDASASTTVASSSKPSVTSASPATTNNSGAPADIPRASTTTETMALSASALSSTTPEASSTSEQSSTPTSSSVASSTLTTSKNPIEQLKEVEDDVKEKVAEIEAEPIILSARV